MADAVRDTPWKWVLSATPAPTGGIALHSKLNTAGGRANDTFVDGTNDLALWNALHTAIGLSLPESGPPKGTDSTPSAPVQLDRKRVLALSFVPLPGVPSLAQKDPAGFALAVGIVLPSAAVWWGAVGSSGQSPGEFVGIGVGGTYAVLVLANQVTGLRTLEKHKVAVTAMPTEGGGGAVVLTGR
jgi:hypothetical protein